MIRLLLIVAIAAVGWYLYRRLTAGPAPVDQKPAAPEEARVARCDECGIHVPEGNGVRYQKNFFCSPEHLQSWLRKNGQP